MAETKDTTSNVVMQDNDGDVIILDEASVIPGLPDISAKIGEQGKPNEPAKPKDETFEVDEPENKDVKGAPADDKDGKDEGLMPFAKALYESGVIPNYNVDDFDGTLDSIFEAIGNEIAIGIKNYKDALPQHAKEIIENYEDGVPLDQLIKVRSRQIEFGNIKDEELDDDTEKQKRILTEFYKIKGFKDEKISKIISKYEDIGELGSEAKEALVELRAEYKKQEDTIKKQAQDQKKVAEDRARKMLETIRQTVDRSEEVIPGIKINKQTKDKIYSSMTDIVEYAEDGRPLNAVMKARIKDPVRFDITLHYLAQLGIFDGKWEGLKNTFKGRVANEIEDAARAGNGHTRSGVSEAGRAGEVKSADVIDSLKKYAKSRQ